MAVEAAGFSVYERRPTQRRDAGFSCQFEIGLFSQNILQLQATIMPSAIISFVFRLFKKGLRLAPVLAAVLLVAWLARHRQGPARNEGSELVRPLRVIEAPVVNLQPRATGYGLAAPRRVWRAMAEVKGVIVEVNPQLAAGALLAENTELIRLESADYELAAARLKATMAESQARLNELDVEERSRKTSLDIERRSLNLAQTSLARMRQLMETGAVPRDQIDREERQVLQQEQALQQLQNAIDLLPARREALQAALMVQKASLAQAELDLARTVIRAPFACRPGPVHLQKGQYVNVGQTLFEAMGTEVIEVEAKFRPEQMRNLLDLERRRGFDEGMNMAALQERFDLDVVVTLRSGAWKASWPARFDRIREVVDPRSRAINVIAAIDKPYELVIPGIRPALTQGMYCEVELRAPRRPETVVLPRAALWNGRVFVVGADNRLQARTVKLAFAQDDFWVVEDGVKAGERVVVSDPSPAMEGMLVAPVPDSQAAARLAQQAEGAEDRP